MEKLRQEIRLREWEDSARKALNGKSGITALTEALEGAAAFDAAEGDLAQQLSLRITRAHAWEEAASAFYALSKKVIFPFHPPLHLPTR